MITPAIKMIGIGKQFGPVRALDNVSLTVQPGTIHGLVGANGAGKSTVIKVLAGIYSKDSGDIAVYGKELKAVTPSTVEAEGVHFIHQDRLMVPTATVAEAIFLNNEPTFGPFLNIRKMRADSAALIKQHFNLDIKPTELIRNLSAAKQKIVQITRALANDAKVLVLDEPTAALISEEVASLFSVLRSLREQGIAIIFISHYIQEIIDICDEVTILRNGQNAGVIKPATSSLQEVVSLMVDRDTSEMYPKRDSKIGEPILEVSNLTINGHFNGVSFKLNKGEVLGITGLLGSGDKALLKCLFGLERPDSGEIALDGRPCKFSSPGNAVDSGIAMIPEDRRAHGVATDLMISENISIASLKRHVKNSFVNTKTEAFEVNRLIDELKVKTPTPLLPVKSLSGGNQQKVVVAKWLSCDSSVYLLDDPTVAVDVGAKVEIYNLINGLADEGKGLIFVSSDLEETVEMCDRILVIYRGEIIEEFKRGDVDGARLLAIASGASAPTEEVVK